MQYYEDINDRFERLNINLDTNDSDAWLNNSKYNKIYNKLWLSQIQNIKSAPIGINPDIYPIVLKPIINLYGMSRGLSICKNKKEYLNRERDGHFWMEYLKGINYNIDLVFKDGKIIFFYCLISEPSINGTFNYHYSNPEYKFPNNIRLFLEKEFEGYSGPMNIEVINNKIIEGHLRFNGDMYFFNDSFLKNVYLMDNLDFFKIYKKEKKYIFPYFVRSNFNINFIKKEDIEEIIFKNNGYQIRWDNIYSDYQRTDLCRLLMYATDNLEDGIEIRKHIKNNILFYEKILVYI